MLKMKTQLTGNINRSALQIHSTLHQLLPGKQKKPGMCERLDMRNAVYTSISTRENNKLKQSIISLADNIPSPVCIV